MVAEAGVKPDSTGTVAEQVSAIFKAAGTTRLADELLDDSNGLAAQLVSSQFAQQVGSSVARRPSRRSPW